MPRRFCPLARFLVSCALVLALLCPAMAESLPLSGSLTPKQGMALLEHYAQGGLTLLDVRTRREFAGGHAPGALNIPVDELAERISEVPDGPVLIICRSGRRAKAAGDLLKAKGRSADRLWHLSGYADYSSGGVRFHD